MSKIQVNEIVNHFDTGAPDCPKGLTVTGFSTFTGGASYSGDVSIGGTLTYEDVTNIDSVGIITAQSGVHYGIVGSGVTIDAVGAGTSLGFLINGSERVRIDSSGRLLVGTSSARGGFDNNSGVSSNLQVEGAGTAASGTRTAFSIVNNGTADSDGPQLYLGRSGGTALNSFTTVTPDDMLGLISFCGTDGNEFVNAASIGAYVAATPGANDMPGLLIFSTTANSASTPTERMRIRDDGAILWFNLPFIAPATDNAVAAGGSSNRFSAIWAANGTIQTSDQRAKTDIAGATLGSEFIKSLRPVSYKWIEGGKVDTGKRDEDSNYIYEPVPGARTHWGFIAQEVKQAVDAAGVDFGGWVLTDKDDPDSQQALRYDQFIAPLTKALQEALEKIETLEAKVAVLEGN